MIYVRPCQRKRRKKEETKTHVGTISNMVYTTCQLRACFCLYLSYLSHNILGLLILRGSVMPQAA